MNKRKFYEKHLNFSLRTKIDYEISPGLKCKYDIIKKIIKINNLFNRSIDLGSSGNSILCQFSNIKHKSFLDISYTSLKKMKYDKSNPSNNNRSYMHPVNADITYLPFRENTFQFIAVIDVLEHIKNDKLTISEIHRILQKKGILVISVPIHRDLFSAQDRLIGHYRRYDLDELKFLLKSNNLTILRIFGIYGYFFKLTTFQARDPYGVEEFIVKLRYLYQKNTFFKHFWGLINKVLSFLMRLDATYRKVEDIMNIGIICSKL